MAVRHGSANYLSQYQDVSRAVQLDAGTAPSSLSPFIAGREKYTIYLLKVTMHVTTAAAQAIGLQDESGNLFVNIPASATVGDQHVYLDVQDGPGVPITEGEDLVITGAAGVAGTLSVVAYRKPTGTMIPSQV
jgi:hypothetical protein